MLIECMNCGGPLDVEPRARVVKCAYCASRNRVAQTRTLQQQTPVGWQPPTVWVPPAHVRASGRKLPYRDYHKLKKRHVAMLAFAAVWAVGLPVAIVFGQAYLRENAIPKKRHTKTSTLTCRNETLEVVDHFFDVEGGLAIDAQEGCVLQIEHTTIWARTGIRAADGTHISIMSSTIRSSGKAITTGDDVSLEIKSSTVASESVAIAGASPSVVCLASRIEGDPAIRLRDSELHDLANCSIRGGAIWRSSK